MLWNARYITNKINIIKIPNILGIKLNAKITNKIDQINPDKSNLVKRLLNGRDEGAIVMVDDKVFETSIDLKRR